MIQRASISYLILLLVLSGLLVACSKNLSPEEQVREFLASGKSAVEERDVIALSELISEGYRDNHRRDRRGLVGLATGYFLRNKNIHLFTQIKQIQFPATDTAKVSLYVAMAGTAVTGAQALIDLRADLVEFDLTLIKESDEWRLQKAGWQRASLDDLLGSE